MSIRNAGPDSFDSRDRSKLTLNPKMLVSAIAFGIGVATLVRCDKVGRSCSQSVDCGPNAVCKPEINLCVSTVDESSLPTIATQGLREGIVGAPYDESLSASGGAGGYRWTLVNPPVALAWLQLDASGGRLTGIPPRARRKDYFRCRFETALRANRSPARWCFRVLASWACRVAEEES